MKKGFGDVINIIVMIITTTTIIIYKTSSTIHKILKKSTFTYFARNF